MRTRAVFIGLAGAALLSAVSGQASAALNKRVEKIQQGDFILIGNTLAYDCGLGAPAPIKGSVMCPAMGVSDKAPDILWRAENNNAAANSTITVEQAQTAAKLTIPTGATVTDAFLFWSARNYTGVDNEVTLQCLGGQELKITADNSLSGENSAYHAAKNVTQYVKDNGSCTYLVSGVQSIDFKGSGDSIGHSAWWMVVLYSDPKEPHRQLVVYDGIDFIGNGGYTSSLVENLIVPNNFATFSEAKVGVVGYDGDTGLSEDRFGLIGDNADPMDWTTWTLISDIGNNNKNDFFNSTRSFLGAPVSLEGDLPQLPGTPGGVSHLDMDVVDVTDFLKSGQTQLRFGATAVEPVFVGGIITSIPTFTDADKDGLSDDEETSAGTNPNDADSDNDGVPDGQEGCSSISNCTNPTWNEDSDGDGLINALDPDSDNDGLYDGTELGLDCSNPATDKTLGHCIADADPSTTTDPLNADTDGGGVNDGSEDTNLNGKIDANETNPTAGHGDDDSMNVDSDGDGLSDGMEDFIGSDKNDGDSDDDGVLDGAEANPADDTDGDGLPNVLDVDSDNDALFDGTEVGSQCDDPATDVSKNHCRPDADPNTKTSMVDADSDNGGVIDGAEDSNLNGKLDPGELDPTAGHGTDDGTVKDSDKDGLSDDLEIFIGSNPNDADSDDDGVPDGKEANPSNDEDGDGKINVLDEDSDQDGLFDGTEGGYGCNGPGTDKSKNHCIPDGDQGKTTTSMVNPDTDGGGVLDGAEDFDKDGKYEPTAGEGNPLDPSDDVNIMICDEDHPDCGPENNGKICDTGTSLCVEGCKDVEGSGCPDGQICIFPDPGVEVGYCGNGNTGGGPTGGGDILVQGGCICEMQPGDGKLKFAWALLVALGAGFAIRRRNRSSS